MMGRRRFVAGAVPASLAASAALTGAGPPARAQTVQEPADQHFSKNEANILAAWCDVIAPGAAAAGVVRFVDGNLAGPYPSSMLLLRYLAAADMAGFYHHGLAGIEQEAKHRFDAGFADLSDAQRHEIVAAAATGKMQVWTDPDPNFFYFITRSDAVDVVYGTEAGFARLDIAYLPHIAPPRPW